LNRKRNRSWPWLLGVAPPTVALFSYLSSASSSFPFGSSSAPTSVETVGRVLRPGRLAVDLDLDVELDWYWGSDERGSARGVTRLMDLAPTLLEYGFCLGGNGRDELTTETERGRDATGVPMEGEVPGEGEWEWEWEWDHEGARLLMVDDVHWGFGLRIDEADDSVAE
jgi:hypothetical protein